MEFKLEKDIVFFDIESTGLSTSQDRIVQLAIVKHFADGREPEEKCRFVNPTIPISKEALEIHGITDEDVKDEPTFAKIANGLMEFIGDADLGGFNSNRFDVLILMEEFNRAGVEFSMDGRKSIDVWKIFQKMEPRNLSAAYKFYCQKEMEGAHDALNDVRATVEILKGQIAMYKGVNYDDDKGCIDKEPIKNDMQSLHDFSRIKGQLDHAGKFMTNDDGVAVFNFGKYQNTPITEVKAKDPGYCSWFLKSDFPSNSKKILEDIIKENTAIC